MQRFSFTNPLISIVIILIRAPLHFTVPISEFYPFGPENGDSALLQDDEISSEEIKLIFGSFTLFQVEHRKLFVNLNGIISFDTEIPYFSNKAVSAMGYSTIAVFYSDIDTHVTGQPEVVHGRVYYRLTNDSNLLQKFKAKVLSTFHDSRVFDPKSMLIATWHEVGYFPEKHDKKNTFQAVLAQGRLHSYVQFLYADDGIQWTASEGKDPHHPEIPAQVGFFNDDGREWPFNISGKESVVNINKQSNHGVPGSYLFRVSGDVIVSPHDSKSTAQNAENSNELDGQEEDYYNEVVSVSSDDYDDDEEMTEQAKSTLPPAPPVDELMTTTTSVSTEPTENIATSQREAVSTVAPMLETTSESAMAPSTLPPCPDSTYQNGCPHDCTEEVLSFRCTRCNCPDVQDETTQTTSTGSMTTFAPPAAPIDRHDAPPPENAAGYSTNAGNPDAKTCQSAGGSACHPNAQCHDSAVGYCCQCSYGYYGNGIECLPNGIAQRINGKVYGQVNGQELPEMDLHTYAEPSDGRAYTAISKMEPNVGRSFLLLNTLGNVMGWLFAKPSSPGSYNGVELTGVRLNRTATVHIGDSHTVTVQQEFTSRDVLDYMKVKMYVIGNLPELPVNATVDFGEYSEEFNRASPGVVKSYSTSEVAINFPGQVTFGAPLKYSITVDQTIRYDECMAKPFDKPTHIILKTERSYVYYDANEKIVRYASANTVDLRTATQDDPCRANDCDQPHMTCVAQQNVHKCLCLDGYELTFADSYDRKGTCVDIDECSRRTHRCDSNAACHNTEGSYTCICNPGYRGTGYKCISQVCSSHQECHVHGACVYSRTLGHYHCQCRPPYFGDGRNCVSHGETCDKVQNCDRNADCVYRQNELGGAYLCRCKSGFSGDGYNCKPSTTPALVQCNILNTCSPNAQCVYAASGNYVCQCKTGYKGDGYRCEIDSASVARHQCRSQEDCHVSGHCVNRDGLEDYFCECLPGFKGDGVNVCEPSDQCNPGVPTSTCGQNAHCSYDDLEHAYICKCDQGYYGDGRSCQAGVRPPVAMPPVVAKTCRDDPSMCHRYAACSIDQSGQSYSCRCNTGYRGDGVQNCEQERERAVCSLVNICDKNARCETNNMGEYECRCNPGYEGDGLYCRRAEDCLQNLNMCDRHAECVPDVSKYVCRCKPGYHGSGTRCTADEDLRDQSIVFAQGMSLVLRGLKENDTAKNLIVVPQQIAVGLDFDCRQTKLFWTDVTGHALRSANADGSNVTLVTDKGLESPEGVAVDPTSGNIYYADSQSDIIGVIRSDGTFNYPLIKDGLVNPRALAIDFVDKKLYFSDWNRERPLIGRVMLDGSQRETFLTDDILLPNGLVILHRRRELCWVDAGKQRLECTSTYGSGRRVVFAPLAHPFGLTVQNEETLYWTDWEDKKIHSISIFGSDHKTYGPSIGSSAKMYGITALTDQCPHAETACLVNNGDCKYLCLPDSRGGRRCVCPENATDPECNVLTTN